MHVEDIITLANHRQKARQINKKKTYNKKLAVHYKVIFWAFIVLSVLSFALAIFSCIKYNDCEGHYWPAFGPFIQVSISIIVFAGHYQYRIEYGEPDEYSRFWFYMQLVTFFGCLWLFLSQVLCV